MTLTQGQRQSVHMAIFFPDHYLLRVTWIGMILHTVVVHDPGVVVAGVLTICLVGIFCWC